MTNLYKVTCKGMSYPNGSGVTHGEAYVIAENAEDAYQKLRSSLDRRSIGDTTDRVLDKIELLAEAGDYPECGMALYD